MQMKAFLILISLFVSTEASRLSIAVFPLVNNSSSDLQRWAGYGFAETMERKARLVGMVQVWDPVFLFRVDSTAWRMNSDSLIDIHRKRWSWDIAVGGNYDISGDSIHLNIKVFWYQGISPVKLEYRYSCHEEQFDITCSAILQRILKEIKRPFSTGDSLNLYRQIKIDMSAYKTYALGYGFEMSGKNNYALTCYCRASELAPDFSIALCREGRLYDKDGNITKARSFFESAVNKSHGDPYIVAETADFIAQTASLKEASNYIQFHREQLEKTAQGLKAIGRFYLNSGEYQRAIATLTKAVALFPSDLDVEFNLGVAYLSASEFPMAIDVFNRLIQYRPNDFRIYSLLGAAYRMSGCLMESSTVLESALKIYPENTTLLVELAHTYFRLEWYKKAEQLLLSAKEINPKLEEIDVNLGVVYWHTGRYREARTCFEKASANPITRQSARANLANVLFMSADYLKAIKIYQAADKYGRRNTIVLYNLAIAYKRINRLKKAAYYFNELLRISPERIDVLTELADIAGKLKQLSQQENFYQRILDLSPYNETALDKYIQVLIKKKRFQDVQRPLETYLEKFPNSKKFLVLLADIYKDMGWLEVALERYKTVEKDFPEEPDGYLGTGKCLLEMIRTKGYQNYENAIYAFKMAAERAPDNPEPDELAGNIYMEYRGYKDLAIEHWKKALEKSKSKKEKDLLLRKISESEEKQ
jgi:tetratricopeptide (TPR) repeat protein